MFKNCSKCKKHLSLEYFHKLKRGKFGRHPRCKICRKIKKPKQIVNIPQSTDNTLCCYDCGKLKFKHQFYKNNSIKRGFQLYCKECQRIKISQSMSKLQNYFKIILAKFKKSHKNYKIDLTIDQLMQIYRSQEECCKITGHKLETIVDKHQRTDKIWNVSIAINDSENIVANLIGKNDISLVCNLVYSTQKLYNLNSEDLIKIYQEIVSKF